MKRKVGADTVEKGAMSFANSRVFAPLMMSLFLTMLLSMQSTSFAFSLTKAKKEAAEVMPAASDIPVLEWTNPDVKPKAAIIALHGATQQAGSFDVLAKHLAEQGYVIVGLDLRGHGRWYFGPFSKVGGKAISYTQSVKDLQALAIEMRKRYPGIPLFCLGESTGAGVAMHAVAERNDLFDGMVLASAGTRTNIFNLKLIVPDLAKGLTNLDKQIDGSPYILKYASEDKRIVNEMVSDPLSRSFLSAKEILKTLWFINSMQGIARKLPAQLPILLLQGGRDHIVSPATAEALMRNMSSDDKRMVVFPDSGHVMLGTSYIKEPIMNLVTKWFNDETVAVNVKIEMAKNPIAPNHVDVPHKALNPTAMLNQQQPATALR
ncbi:MAG: lysophospholipase [Candidatus Obscuribacterales bacterium]|nr:lysophospholipase [Candidatus Obscuribacterales bacterium]